MGSANGRTETHGTIRALSKECTVSRQEGLHLVGTRYVGREGKAEYLLLLTNSDPEEAIQRYRRRWEIETLFGALKSRGFDLEATHLRAPGRIRKLIALLPVAFIWAHLVGLWRQEREGPLRLAKSHGRLEKSVFRYGLDHLRRLLLLAATAEEAFERCLRLLREPQRVLSGTQGLVLLIPTTGAENLAPIQVSCIVALIGYLTCSYECQVLSYECQVLRVKHLLRHSI